MTLLDSRARILDSTVEDAATKPGNDLPPGAGPADYWLAILLDKSASAQRRDEAARELRRLGANAVRAAQQRRQEAEEEAWWNSLSEAEQKEFHRKGRVP